MVFNYQNYKSKEISTECTLEYKGIKGFVIAVSFKYITLLKLKFKRFKFKRFKFVYQLGNTPIGEQKVKIKPKIKLVRMKDG